MSIEGIYIPVEGDVRVVSIDPENTLIELQGYVEGYIEAVPLSGNNEMYVSESGLIDGLELNERATRFARDNFKYSKDELMPGWPGVTIHGDAIVVAVDFETGDTVSTTLTYSAAD